MADVKQQPKKPKAVTQPLQQFGEVVHDTAAHLHVLGQGVMTYLTNLSQNNAGGGSTSSPTAPSGKPAKLSPVAAGIVRAGQPAPKPTGAGHAPRGDGINSQVSQPATQRTTASMAPPKMQASPGTVSTAPGGGNAKDMYSQYLSGLPSQLYAANMLQNSPQQQQALHQATQAGSAAMSAAMIAASAQGQQNIYNQTRAAGAALVSRGMGSSSAMGQVLPKAYQAADDAYMSAQAKVQAEINKGVKYNVFGQPITALPAGTALPTDQAGLDAFIVQHPESFEPGIFSAAMSRLSNAPGKALDIENKRLTAKEKRLSLTHTAAEIRNLDISAAAKVQAIKDRLPAPVAADLNMAKSEVTSARAVLNKVKARGAKGSAGLQLAPGGTPTAAPVAGQTSLADAQAAYDAALSHYNAAKNYSTLRDVFKQHKDNTADYMRNVVVPSLLAQGYTEDDIRYYQTQRLHDKEAQW